MPSTGAPERRWYERTLTALRSRVAADSHERLLWAVRVRWLVIAGFFGLGVFAARVGFLPALRPCVQAAVAAVVLNAVNHWCVRRRRHLGAVTALAVPADVLLITYLVVSSGGVGSPFLMMYVVQVVATAMLVDLAVAATAAAASAASLLGALYLQRLGLIAAAPAAAVAAIDESVSHAVWALFLLYCLGLLAYLAGYISERLRDSERRLAERTVDLEQALDSLGRTHADLAATHERLLVAEGQLVQAEKLRAVGQFVAGIAHELNNPHSVEAGNIDHLRRVASAAAAMLADYEAEAQGWPAAGRLAARRRTLRLDELLDDLPAVLDDCHEGARRAKEIVAALQAFSRGEAVGRWEAANVQSGLDRTLALLRPRLSEVAIERDYEDLPAIECMPGQLDQVFLNLLTNALDAIGERRGTIAVRAWLDAAPPAGEPSVVVSIRDDGAGIPAELQARIFDPFFTTKAPGRGTGLGLSVSYGIVERHGGTLTVESAVGEGSTFTVRLPVRRAPRHAREPQRALTDPGGRTIIPDEERSG
jgi:signal transduction histidine kinase